MLHPKNKQTPDAPLDGVARNLIRSAGGDAAEIEAAAASPFLYSRLIAHIRASREEVVSRGAYELWLAALWRTVPAMVLASALAVGAFLFIPRQTSPGNFNAEVIYGVNDTQIGRVAFADRGALTNDEVLSAIISDDDQQQEGTR